MDFHPWHDAGGATARWPIGRRSTRRWRAPIPTFSIASPPRSRTRRRAIPADVLLSMPDDVASFGFEVPGAVADIRATDGFHGACHARRRCRWWYPIASCCRPRSAPTSWPTCSRCCAAPTDGLSATLHFPRRQLSSAARVPLIMYPGWLSLRLRRGPPAHISAPTRSIRCWRRAVWPRCGAAKMKGFEGFEKRVVIKTMLTNAAASARAARDVRQRGVAGGAPGPPQHRRRLRFRRAGGRYFIAMSYVPGLTLRSVHRRMLIQRGQRLPVAAALHIIRDLCEALQHVHELEDGSGPLGLVHRDCRPDNIIISTSGTRQADRLRGGPRHGAHAAEPALRRPLSLRGPGAHPDEGEDCRSDAVLRRRRALPVPDGRAPVRRHRRRRGQGRDGEPRRATRAAVPAAAGQRRRAGEEGDRERPAGSLRERAPAGCGDGARACFRLARRARSRRSRRALSALLEPGRVATAADAVEAVPQAVGERAARRTRTPDGALRGGDVRGFRADPKAGHPG